MEEKKKLDGARVDLIKTIIGLVLCAIFGFILVCNIIIVVKGAANPTAKEPPSIFGVMPIVVKSDSMHGNRSGHLEKNDLIFIKKVPLDSITVDKENGSVITFISNVFKDGSVEYTTHRAVDRDAEGIITQGDSIFNVSVDESRVTEENFIGVVTGRIPLLGGLILFMKEWYGILTCVALPILAFIAYDVVMRVLQQKKLEKQQTAAKEDKTAALEAELARLRALAGEAAPTPKEEPKEEPKETPTDTPQE